MRYSQKNYIIEFNDTIKAVMIYDLNDRINCPASFNKNKRGYTKFKKDYHGVVGHDDRSSFNQWVTVMNLPKYNLKMHTWCMTD
jgi:hypothetical protein